MAYCAFRVYRKPEEVIIGKVKEDEKGTFEGWSVKFDEWIPVFCPRITPFGNNTGKNRAEEMDLDEDIDDYFPAEEGFERVYAVPRPMKCLSS